MPGDAWDPGQYHRFAAERRQPFNDLLALVDPAPGGRVADLGCGSGELTLALHGHVGAAETVGYDTSDAMLDAAAVHAGRGVRFEHRDIARFDDPGAWDVVLSNAALQWVGDHAAVLGRWAVALRPGGQLAVQVPANADHPSHTVAVEVAHEAPFLEEFEGSPPRDPVRSVLPPEAYAQLLFDLGLVDLHVRLQVYGHVLRSTADVVEWVRGTSLTRFRRVLDDEVFDRFLVRYRDRLLDRLGQRSPYFYAFKRILMTARRP